MTIEVPDITSKINFKKAKKQKIKFYINYKFINSIGLSCPSSKKAKD
jgi:hypothetical protein